MRLMSPREWIYAETICLAKLWNHVSFWFLWRKTFFKNFNRLLEPR